MRGVLIKKKPTADSQYPAATAYFYLQQEIAGIVEKSLLFYSSIA
jgi:hypothetical protein